MPSRALALHCLACAFTYICIRAQVYYDFGLSNVIRKLFGDPEWAAGRGKGRDASAAGFYGSREAARLDRLTAGLFAQDSSSAYELGMDFGQIFNFKTHSTGIVLLRRATGCGLEHILCASYTVDTMVLRYAHISAVKLACNVLCRPKRLVMARMLSAG